MDQLLHFGSIPVFTLT